MWEIMSNMRDRKREEVIVNCLELFLHLPNNGYWATNCFSCRRITASPDSYFRYRCTWAKYWEVSFSSGNTGRFYVTWCPLNLSLTLQTAVPTPEMSGKTQRNRSPSWVCWKAISPLVSSPNIFSGMDDKWRDMLPDTYNASIRNCIRFVKKKSHGSRE